MFRDATITKVVFSWMATDAVFFRGRSVTGTRPLDIYPSGKLCVVFRRSDRCRP